MARMNKFAAGVDWWQSRRIGKPKSKMKICLAWRGQFFFTSLLIQRTTYLHMQRLLHFWGHICHMLWQKETEQVNPNDPNLVVVPGDSNLFCWDLDISNCEAADGEVLMSDHLTSNSHRNFWDILMEWTHVQNVPRVRDILSLVIHLLFPSMPFTFKRLQ